MLLKSSYELKDLFMQSKCVIGRSLSMKRIDERDIYHFQELRRLPSVNLTPAVFIERLLRREKLSARIAGVFMPGDRKRGSQNVFTAMKC